MALFVVQQDSVPTSQGRLQRLLLLQRHHVRSGGSYHRASGAPTMETAGRPTYVQTTCLLPFMTLNSAKSESLQKVQSLHKNRGQPPSVINITSDMLFLCLGNSADVTALLLCKLLKVPQ